MNNLQNERLIHTVDYHIRTWNVKYEPQHSLHRISFVLNQYFHRIVFFNARITVNVTTGDLQLNVKYTIKSSTRGIVSHLAGLTVVCVWEGMGEDWENMGLGHIKIQI